MQPEHVQAIIVAILLTNARNITEDDDELQRLIDLYVRVAGKIVKAASK